MKQLTRNIVCFPSVPWNHNWERQHEFISRLAQQTSGRVEVVAPLGMINHSLGGILRKVTQRFSTDRGIGPSNPVQPNMDFVNAMIVPYHFNSSIDRFNKKLLKNSLQSDLSQSIGYFTYVNAASLRLMDYFGLTILDLAQRRQVSTELSDELKAAERQAVAKASIVTADNRAVIKDYENTGADIHHLPQGVNLSDFEAPEAHPQLVKKRKGYRKVIGYMGTDMVLDYELFIYLAENLPDCLFVFVGQIQREEGEKLLKLPNLWHVGRVPHQELAAYLRGFDLGLIPYQLNDFTQGVFPTKAFEYLAAGVPVLSTQLPELQPYQGAGLQLAATREESLTFVKILLAERPSREKLRRSVVDKSWQSRFATLVKFIEDQSHAKKFEL